MQKEVKALLENMEFHLRQMTVLASVSNLSSLRHFESEDEFGRISNIVRKLTGNGQPVSLQTVSNVRNPCVIRVFRPIHRPVMLGA